MSATVSTLVYLIMATVTIYSGLLLSACWLIASRGRKPRPGEDVPGPEEMKRHMVGMYYCNADDPRGWVLLASENTKRFRVDKQQHLIDGEYSASRRYTINMRYRSWATAFNALFVGGAGVLTLVAVAAPLLTK